MYEIKDEEYNYVICSLFDNQSVDCVYRVSKVQLHPGVE